MQTRRDALLLGALGLAACSTAGASPAKKASPKQTFVLVHGAWHGGWCWRDVKQGLMAQGHMVYTPTLTGLGERSHLNTPDVNLTTHVQDIAGVIQYEELNNIILLGHSYAGYVISLLADRHKDKIKSLVYLDAVLPVEGSSFIPEAQHERMKTAYAEDYSLPPMGLDFLGIPKDHPKADWVSKNLNPHPLATLLQPVEYQNNGADGLPKTFMRCTQSPRYKDGDPVKDQIKDDPEWTYLTIDSGHNAMVTKPDELTTLLTQI